MTRLDKGIRNRDEMFGDIRISNEMMIRTDQG